MKLTSVRITNYKSILDSGEVTVGDITALVGKNESGKTAFLQALHLLNPLNPIKGKKNYNDVTDYPSKAFSVYKRSRSTNPANVVTAKFELEEDEVKNIELSFGKKALTSKNIVVSRGYEGKINYLTEFKDTEAFNFLISNLELNPEEKAIVGDPKNESELLASLQKLPEPRSATTTLISHISSWRSNRIRLYLIDNFLAPVLPKFFYFDDYSIMRGRVSLPNIQNRKTANTLDESERTFLSLLGTADAELTDFQGTNFEELTRQLEAAANSITEQVFEFWSQNRDLRVNIQISAADPTDEPPLNSGPIFNVRIQNLRHNVTVPFDERSRGFVWFFSFFAYFGNLSMTEKSKVILLLDEPGVSLHAKAQGDFLRFIESRLAPERQVIYSTHSPFLIDPKRLDRVRVVEDVDTQGTIVSSDVLTTDQDTVFPLQAALGYELAQTLFLGPNTLLVEGPSDLIYLQLLSEAAESRGLTSLDSRWVVTPVGGSSNLVTFISLIGANQLNVAVLMDSKSGDQQKIRKLQASGHLREESLIQISEFTENADADIEDLFDPALYLELVNSTYGIDPKFTLEDLRNKSPRIIFRVGELFKERNISGGVFSHLKPASFLLTHQNEFVDRLTFDDYFIVSNIFARINSLLK